MSLFVLDTDMVSLLPLSLTCLLEPRKGRRFIAWRREPPGYELPPLHGWRGRLVSGRQGLSRCGVIGRFERKLR